MKYQKWISEIKDSSGKVFGVVYGVFGVVFTAYGSWLEVYGLLNKFVDNLEVK